MTTYIKVADPSALVRQAQSTMARNRYEADEQRVQAQTLRPELSPERARQLATVSDADAGVISVPRRQVRFRREEPAAPPGGRYVVTAPTGANVNASGSAFGGSYNVNISIATSLVREKLKGNNIADSNSLTIFSDSIQTSVTSGAPSLGVSRFSLGISNTNFSNYFTTNPYVFIGNGTTMEGSTALSAWVMLLYEVVDNTAEKLVFTSRVPAILIRLRQLDSWFTVTREEYSPGWENSNDPAPAAGILTPNYSVSYQNFASGISNVGVSFGTQYLQALTAYPIAEPFDATPPQNIFYTFQNGGTPSPPVQTNFFVSASYTVPIRDPRPSQP